MVSGLPALSVHDPASIAGLPARSARVEVRPPLFWSGPSWGSVLLRSPVAFSPQAFLLSRLKPSDWNVPDPAQFCTDPEVLSATIVFLSPKIPVLSTNRPPPRP